VAGRKAGTIKWNLKGFEEIRRMPEVEDLLQAEVSRVLAEVNGDYDGGVESGASRSRGFVVTTSGDAIRQESEEHTLLRAISSGGGLG
jgi:hypothetical protein